MRAIGFPCVASIASLTSAGCNADNNEMLSNALSPKFWANCTQISSSTAAPHKCPSKKTKTRTHSSKVTAMHET